MKTFPHSAFRIPHSIEPLEARIAPALLATLNLSSLDGKTGFKINGEAASDASGFSVSGAGDVNGDGFADLIIGADYASPNGTHSGASYVVFGKAGGFTTPLELSTLNGVNGFKINGEAGGDLAGFSVSAAGDVNGDGFADLLIGAKGADPNGSFSGASYVVFGKTCVSATGTFELSTLNGVNGFKINGEAAGDQSGNSVSAAGDVNGDGFADLLIGAFSASPNGNSNSGASYVVFGSSPIALSKDHKTATFPDTDGDIVSVKVSKGALSRHDFTFTSNGSLGTLDLHDSLFAGTDVTISAKLGKNGAGNGVVFMDKIDAHGIDLGKVSVSGELEQIFAGDSFVKTPGVKSLTVDTLGSNSSGPTAAELHSKIVGALGTLTVKGDAEGMDFEVTGGQFAGIGKIAITGFMNSFPFNTGKAGFIHASGDIGAVSVGHDVIGGADFSGIAAGGRLGKVTIGGALTSPNATKPVILSALGKLGATTVKDAVAIASVSVKTDVLNARILAGYDINLTPLNPDAGIGAISVGANWDASSIAAGVQDTSTAGDLTSAPDGFGQNDTLIGGDTMPAIFATIASITIKGTAMGSASAGDFFGITAQKIGKVSIPGVVFPLASADVAVTADFHLVTL